MYDMQDFIHQYGEVIGLSPDEKQEHMEINDRRIEERNLLTVPEVDTRK